MGMESYGGESRPDVLNSLWPEGRDSLKYGDNHLRLVKTVVKNFYSDFTSFKTKIEGYFDSSGNAKKALDSDKLGQQDPSYYLDGANATGTLSGTKVQSSTTARRGTVQLYSGVNSTSQALAATASAVKAAYDLANHTNGSKIGLGHTQAGPWKSITSGNYTDTDTRLFAFFNSFPGGGSYVITGIENNYSDSRVRYRRIL